MKSVLIVSYFFPPLGAGSVLRTLKFVRYLPSYGWRPVVLTVSNPLGVCDPDLEDQLPAGAVVHRVPYIEPGHLANLFRRIVRTVASAHRNGAGQDRDEIRGQMPVVVTPGMFRRLCDRMLQNVLLPDTQISWLLPGVLAGRDLIRRYDIRMLYSTYTPGTAHLIAGLLKARTGIPWVADFRDPWLQCRHTEAWSSWRKKVIEKIEGWTLRHCDHVTAVSRGIVDGMAGDHGGASSLPPWTIIPNGFDPEDFENAKGANRGRFTLVYCGTLYRDRDPDPVVRVVSRLIKDGLIPAEEIELRFVGSVPREWEERWKDYDLGGVVTKTGHLPHRMAVEEMMSAHALLMTVVPGHGSSSMLTLKIFEYLATERPILYVGPESAASEILVGAEGAFVVDYSDLERLAKIIHELYGDFKNNRVVRIKRSARLSQWTRPSLTKKLAAIFDTLSSSSVPSVGSRSVSQIQ